MALSLSQIYLLLCSVYFVQGELYLAALAGGSSRRGDIMGYTGEVGGAVEISLPSAGIAPESFHVIPSSSNWQGFYSWSTTSGVENKTLLVNVTEGSDITLLGHMGGRADTPEKYGYTSLLPISALGTRYIVSLCELPDTSHQYVLAVATHALSSRVDIKFSLEGSVSYDNTQYNDGDTLSLSLAEYQTFTITSDSDLSGTVVSSSHTVAVFAGTRHLSEDYIAYEQMFPVSLLGTEYVIASSSFGDSVLQVVSEHSDTRIMFNNGSTKIMAETRVFRQTLGRNDVVYFNTNQSVMVTMCTRDNSYIDLAVIPPTRVYTTGETFVSGSDNSNNDDLMILSEVDGEVSVSPGSISWTVVDNSGYRVGRIGNRSSWLCTVTSQSRYTVLVVLHLTESYAVGYNFSITATSSTSVPELTSSTTMATSSAGNNVFLWLASGLFILLQHLLTYI